jgi:hypothetical protein
MKLREFRDFAEWQTIHLRNSRTGKTVAKSKKGLDRFNDIEVHKIFTELEFGTDKKYARPIIVCWVHDYDVCKIKESEGLRNYVYSG